MNLHKHLACACALTIMTTAIVVPANAGMWDNPENLKVLPEDISPDELRDTMRGFATGTGSRCSTCHVGEDESDLRTYDFSLDDKEKKLKARVMITMVQNINRNLVETFDKHSGALVKVACATCHRGQARPEMLEDVLDSAYQKEGLEQAILKYRALRERYYGGYTFDFSEKALMTVAENLGKAGELDAALGFIGLNLEYYPESARSFVLQARILAEKDDIPAARASFQKALAIDPDNPWTKRMLSALPE